ncbi:MFS transporter [Burkholderia cepacia]|uniref:MFS transporter n=1 Tax=Burkholderia cepacia TaxID=292 RepID=UPI0007C71513|nr:MFS transporter [Burkholderia cepacia]MCA8111800.1 MFS transporter [Burkholderia cepacia]MCA8398970.1 MFS transporter [Burkholderia cepacia]
MRSSQAFVIPLIAASSLLMEQIDATVISTAIPKISTTLGVSVLDLKLAISVYLIGAAVSIPVSGWIADRFGTRTTFLWAMATFIGSSILCGSSSSFAQFVSARLLQGIGGSVMTLAAQMIVLKTIAKTDTVRILSYLSIPALIGPVLGPPIGGFIATFFSWRWIFLINVPIGLAGMAAAALWIKNVREEHGLPFDWSGFCLVASGLVLTMFCTATLAQDFISVPLSLTIGGIGIAALFAYRTYARRTPRSLLHLALLRIPTFRIGVLGGAFARVGLGATPFLLPLMLQLGFGRTPFESGLLTCVPAAGSILLKTAAPFLLGRYGFRRALLWSIPLSSLSIALLGYLTPSTPFWIVVALLFAGGCARSLQFAGLNTLTYADIPATEVTHASSLATAVQQFSLNLGLSVGALFLAGSGWARDHRGTAAQDFLAAFIGVALVCLCALVLVRQLAPDAGSQLTDSRKSA